MDELAQALEDKKFKVVFGLQPDQIKLIEETIKEFNGASIYVFEKVGKQISWCPKTLACYYINYLLDSHDR